MPPSPPVGKPGNDLISFPSNLTATATLQSNSQGGVNAIALKNPLGGPMELLEVAWELQANAAAISGGAVGCKLDLGNLELTNGFVPIWCFGAGRYLEAEPWWRMYTPEAANTGVPIHYIWKLDHPLYIPSGAVVQPQFQHFGQIKDTIDVRISYRVRMLPKHYTPPAKIPVPYVAAFTSKVFRNPLTPDTDEDHSTETDLLNKNEQPLRVRRFIGRFGSSLITEGIPFESRPLYGPAAAEYTEVKMVSSQGDKVIQYAIPFRQAFPGPIRAWEVDFSLPPKQYMLVDLFKRAFPVTAAAATQLLSQAFVSMVGSREVPA